MVGCGFADLILYWHFFQTCLKLLLRKNSTCLDYEYLTLIQSTVDPGLTKYLLTNPGGGIGNTVSMIDLRDVDLMLRCLKCDFLKCMNDLDIIELLTCIMSAIKIHQ